MEIRGWRGEIQPSDALMELDEDLLCFPAERKVAVSGGKNPR
jgi:hypothetical protein